jgi:hypothetical protein
MVRVFESLYWDWDKFKSSLNRLIKKDFKKYKESAYIKTVLLPYRLIRYLVKDKYREALIDISTYNNIEDPLNLIFTVRNDYLRLNRFDMKYSSDSLLKYKNLSNEEIIRKFLALLSSLRESIEEYRGSKFGYARNLARYNLNRIILGPLQGKRKLIDSEEKAKEAMKLEFIKGIIEDGLGLQEDVNEIDNRIITIYMPTLFVKVGEEVFIYEVGKKKIRVNKNLAFVYSREERYRDWLSKLLI